MEGARALALMASELAARVPVLLAAAVSYGVVKVNLDSEAQYAFTRGAAGHMFTEYDGVLMIEGGVGRKAAYDPRAWGAKAQDAMAERVAGACRQLGSAGRSLSNAVPVR